MKNIKIKAFSMAEILITLAVIGVVLALVIPAVTANYRAKSLETQNNKARFLLENGFRLLMVLDGAKSLNKTQVMSCSSSDKACISTQIKRVFKVKADNVSSNSVFNKKYNFTSGLREVWTNSSIPYAFITPEGMIFGISIDKDSNSIVAITDLNGAKNPNKGAEDLRKYVLSNNLMAQELDSAMADWGGTSGQDQIAQDQNSGGNQNSEQQTSDPNEDGESDCSAPGANCKQGADTNGFTAHDADGNPLNSNALELGAPDEGVMDQLKNAIDNNDLMGMFPPEISSQIPESYQAAEEAFDLRMADETDVHFPLDINVRLISPYEPGHDVAVIIYDGEDYSLVWGHVNNDTSVTFTTDKFGTFIVVSE